jgi:S1-C subfamily serine protease
MLLEVKITTGARAGQTKRLEKPVISVGRNPDVDIRFDPQKDLDVSGKHAEFRAKGAGYELHDLGSTNGTFVNGERLTGSVELRTADTIRFGANGPEVEVSFHVTGAYKVVGATEERIALAVKKQTAGLRRILVSGLGIIAIGAGGAYFVGQRAAAKQVEMLQKQLENNDSQIRALQNGVPGDTVLANELGRELNRLRKELDEASTDEAHKRISGEMERVQNKLAAIERMDMPTVNSQNAPAVAILITQIDGKNYAGTAFAITKDGMMLTNRHNVQDWDTKKTANKLVVKFRDTKDYLPAHVVKISDSLDVDLALIQLDDKSASVPTVNGIQARDEGAQEGATVATIGFPLGYETAQEGNGEDFIAKTTLGGGTVSKRTSFILQLDAFAAHGSSGSPILNAKGNVVGVLYGGPPGASGKIVYAVPTDHIAAFLPEAVRSGVVK